MADEAKPVTWMKKKYSGDKRVKSVGRQSGGDGKRPSRNVWSTKHANNGEGNSRPVAKHINAGTGKSVLKSI